VVRVKWGMTPRVPFALALVLFITPLAATAQPRPPGGQGDRRPIAGQMPARGGQRPNEAPRGTAVVRGAVVAADSGSPIRRAQVRVSGQGVGNRLATTDAQGRFEFKELPAGRITLSATKGGFVTLQYGQRRPSESGTPLDLAEGQILDKLTIGLPRGSVISGRITDEFGEPMANAVVTAMRYGYAAGTRRLLPGGGQNSRDTTDDQGQFRLFGLSPGEYMVSAAFRAGGGEVTDPAGEPSGYAPTYYPGTPNASEAQRVNVGLGQEQSGVVFSLVATRLVRVTGAVISSQGTPVANAMVMLMPAGGRLGNGAMLMQGASARVDGSGQFRLLNVAPGRYVAQSRMMRGRPDQDPTAEFGRQELTVGGEDLDGVVLVTRPGARVTGQIVADSGTALTMTPQQVQVSARLAEPDQAAPGGGGGNARVNADWSFELNGLFDPRLFRAMAPQGWSLKSVTLNGQDITDTPIEMPPGQTIAGVQIALSNQSTDVSGRVTDARGAAVTDVSIVVFPADQSRWTYLSRFVRAARPDQEGRYQIQGLPGYDRYLAVAVQGLEDGQAGDPEFLATIRDLGTSFSLNDGETRALDLRFRPPR
jgi:hypothetical protein